MSTLHQINQKAQQILRAELGPIDYVRYQQQFSQGNGDYTAERQVCASEDISIIAERVASLKSAGLLSTPSAARILEINR
ncbi:MAG TPA: hypothetical protein DDW21_06710 [Verrucomicrobiales bacterium]|nr:MAG: hypothetical protein B9S37_10145 [Verrucomicrobiae bacterium Tous-C3TDCM]PAZ04647.1 MAG: hypothetical protein CAK88_10915 [Verrucomicrobiae bacterium AMD-G2]HBE23125.1 hypothetical protein [Verrucomicrobiales bacterium]